MVTHLDPIKAALAILLDLKPEALYRWQIRNASLTILKHAVLVTGHLGLGIVLFSMMLITVLYAYRLDSNNKITKGTTTSSTLNAKTD